MSDANPRDELRDLCFDAAAWVDVLGEGDAHATVDKIVGHVTDVLRRDPRMPRLARADWDLLLADARKRAAEELTGLIEGMGNTDDAINSIVDAVLEHYRRRECSEGADAEAGA